MRLLKLMQLVLPGHKIITRCISDSDVLTLCVDQTKRMNHKCFYVSCPLSNLAFELRDSYYCQPFLSYL